MDENKDLSETVGSEAPVEGMGGSWDGDVKKIGRYTILGLLGKGGFGRVYLAHDDDLDRSVAIKVPNPERIADLQDAEAFLGALGSDRLEPWGQTDLELLVEIILNRSDPKKCGFGQRGCISDGEWDVQPS